MAGRLDLPVTAAVLLLVVLSGAVALTWRYVAWHDRAPSDYYSFQINRWEQQLAKDSEDPLVWSTLGELYREAGREEDADEAFARALELDPSDPAANLRRARAYVEAGDLDAAREHVVTALEGLPEGGRAYAYFRLGEIEERAGDIPEAIRAYEASVADRDSYFNAHYALAGLYEQEGRFDDALEAAVMAERFMPGRPDLVERIERLRARGATISPDVSPTSAGG